MAATLELDPSRPCQIADGLLALWLPRGRGRDELASGMLATVNICGNPACSCTIATLHARLIDDRAMRATYDEDKLSIAWRVPPRLPPAPEGQASLQLDITTGQIGISGGAEPPALVSRFFEDPLPYWVLDDLWDRWRARRPALGVDWRAQALEAWEPGTLLPTMLVQPEERPDRYLVDGTVYQVDTMYCVEPSCSCTEARFAVFSVDRENDEAVEVLREVASARLSPATMIPDDFVGERRFSRTLISIYQQWRRRNVPPERRLLELRELTRQRGFELHRLTATPAPSGALSRPPLAASAPGRNAPCPCGSGKKYKRCCGR